MVPAGEWGVYKKNRRLRVGDPTMMINRTTLMRLLCVALVAGVMLPVGTVVFPYVSHALDGTQFQALEAVFTATVGYGLYALIG
jgi:hypothetical protein